MAHWKFDSAHSSVTFAVRHMMVATVRGQFQSVTGSLDFDPAHPEAASVTASIDANSITTGVADRDNHLRSADFLEVANHPTITFRSTRVEPLSESRARLTGDLTIRGTTRPVTLDVEYLGQHKSLYNDMRAGFTATTKINREDFGLTWNQALEAGGVLVGKEISIALDVEGILETEAVVA